MCWVFFVKNCRLDILGFARWSFYSISSGGFIFCLLFLLPDLVWAGSVNHSRSQWILKNWRTGDGLPETQVHCVFQDRDGYLWIGTTGGGVRFDGTEFVELDWWDGRFYAKDIEEDAEGNLWVATKSGVLVHDGHETRHLWPALETTSLARSKSGGIWVGTENGIVLLEGENERWWAPSDLPNSFIYDVLEDLNGRVWVGTVVGLYQFDLEVESFAPIWKSPYPHPEPEYGIARCIAESDDGMVWFGTDHSVFRWHEGRLDRFRLGPSSVRNRVGNIYQDPFGTMYFSIGGDVFSMGDHGPIRWSELGGTFDSYVNSMRVDREGNVWLGTRHGGVFCLSPTPVRVHTTANGLSHNDIRSVTHSQEGLWIGTGSGVDLFRDGRIEPIALPRYVEEPIGVRSVLEARDGEMWIGGDTTAITRRSKPGDHNTVDPFRSMISDQQVRFIMEDIDQSLWIGSRYGLTHILPRETVFRVPERPPVKMNYSESWIYRKKGTERWVVELGADGFSENHGFFWEGDEYREMVHGELDLRDPQHFMFESDLTSDDFTAGMVDRGGKKWLGTSNGEVFWIQGRALERFDATATKIDGRVQSFWEDEQGGVWIGSESGLSHWDGESFSHFDPRRYDLPWGAIRQVQGDSKGFLWLGGSHGIYRVRQKDLMRLVRGKRDRVPICILDHEDGLLSSDVSVGTPGVCLDTDGKIWMPTTYGLVEIDPERMRDDSKLPSPVVRIDSVSANGKMVLNRLKSTTGTESAILPLCIHQRDASQIVFRFSIPEFSRPGKVRFRHRGGGVGDSWSADYSERQIQFASLGPGNYRIEIDGRTDCHDWSQRPATVMLKVTPFLYRRWEFQILIGLCVGICLWGLHRMELRRRDRLLALEHRAAMADERNRIASDIHDDLGARVHQLGLLTELAVGELKSGKEIGQFLDRQMNVGRELSQSVDEIVWMLNPRNDSLGRFLIYIKEYSVSLLEMAGIDVSVRVPVLNSDLAVNAGWRHGVLLIIKECLRNIIQHSRAHRVTITVNLYLGKHQAVLEIVDDGVGIDGGQTSESKGNGLVNMCRRAEKLGGKITIRGAGGEGARVCLLLPIPSPASLGGPQSSVGKDMHD